MFEKLHEPLASRRKFLWRIVYALILVLLLTIIALIIGMIGYHFTVGLSWLDSFLNAAMILSTMGPIAALKTVPAKIFASLYALFSGLVFITILSFIFAPVFHRLLHSFYKG